MNIKPILKRLATTFSQTELAENLLLVPADNTTAGQQGQSPDCTHLVVGYTGSPNSHAALDLTLWIAHQTRLATAKPVVVQVAYVVPAINILTTDLSAPGQFDEPTLGTALPIWRPHESATAMTQTATGTLERPTASLPVTTNLLSEQYEYADQILWQARCLANEWRGSLKTHLRFGDVATELRQVVEEETATLLILGCSDVTHPLVYRMRSQFPCPILGIPATPASTLLNLESV